MKVYTYNIEEVGLPSEWTAGAIRLEGAVPTDVSAEADVFLVPASLTELKRAGIDIRKLPFIHHPERHVFFDISDDTEPYEMNCIFIQCSLTEKMLAKAPNSIAWPWPVDDLFKYSPIPTGGFQYDVSFHGWDSRPVRTHSIASCRVEFGSRFDSMVYREFYGHVERDKPAEGAERRKKFLNSLHLSKIALSPRSVEGNLPYRFYEGMSAGRIPVLVCDGHILPWKDEIEWERCALFIQEDKAASVGKIIRQTLVNTPDSALHSRMGYARWAWERYLDRSRWPILMREAVEKKLGR